MKLTKLLIAIIALALASCCESAKGATVLFNLNSIQSGATPSGVAPWGTIAFVDDGTNTVLTVIKSNLQSSNEFITEVNFNVDPTLSLSNLTATPIGGSGSFSYDGLPILSLNNVQGGTGALYDVGVNFDSTNKDGGIHRFDGQDESWILLTYTGTGTFNANSFNFAEPNKGEFSTAHVQGIGESANQSAWITQVPEPSTTLLGGLGAFALLRRKRH